MVYHFSLSSFCWLYPDAFKWGVRTHLCTDAGEDLYEQDCGGISTEESWCYLWGPSQQDWGEDLCEWNKLSCLLVDHNSFQPSRSTWELKISAIFNKFQFVETDYSVFHAHTGTDWNRFHNCILKRLCYLVMVLYQYLWQLIQYSKSFIRALWNWINYEKCINNIWTKIFLFINMKHW